MDWETAKWVMGAVVAVGSGIWAVFSYWNTARIKKETDVKAAERQSHMEQIAASQAASKLELEKLKEGIAEREQVKIDQAKLFRTFDGKLDEIRKQVVEFRKEFHDEISRVKQDVQALDYRIARIEQDMASTMKVVERKRKQLNGLTMALQSAGIVTSIDPDSSTGFSVGTRSDSSRNLEVPKPRRS